MTFCTINSINIPVENEAAGADVDIFGRPARGILGHGTGSLSKSKRVYNLKVPVVSNADFLAYQGLVSGLGHVMPLQENCYTADGISAVADGSFTGVFQAAGLSSFDGGSYYFVKQPALTSIYWPYEDLWPYGTTTDDLNPGYTVAWVTSSNTPGVDHNMLVTNDEQIGYKNGVAVAYSGPTWTAAGLLDVAFGAAGVAITNTSADTYLNRYHEVVFLPFRLSSTQMIDITTRTKRFGSLPYVTLSGDIVNGASVTCIGTDGTSDFVPSTFSGVFGGNNNLSFTLQEK
jgi:hypothetical protein